MPTQCVVPQVSPSLRWRLRAGGRSLQLLLSLSQPSHLPQPQLCHLLSHQLSDPAGAAGAEGLAPIGTAEAGDATDGAEEAAGAEGLAPIGTAEAGDATDGAEEAGRPGGRGGNWGFAAAAFAASGRRSVRGPALAGIISNRHSLSFSRSWGEIIILPM